MQPGAPSHRARCIVILVVPSPSRLLDRLVFRSACAFFLGELFGLVGLADLGGDDVEDPTAQDPQLPRPELRRLLATRCASAFARISAADLLGRQLVERVSDHLRLRQVHLTPTQRRQRPGSTACPAPPPTPGHAGSAPRQSGCGGSPARPRHAHPRPGPRRRSTAITRSFNAATCASTRVSSSNAAFLSAGAMNIACTSAVSFSADLDRGHARQHRVHLTERGAHRDTSCHRRRTNESGSHVSMQRACEQRTPSDQTGPGRSLSITIGSNLCSILQVIMASPQRLAVGNLHLLRPRRRRTQCEHPWVEPRAHPGARGQSAPPPPHRRARRRCRRCGARRIPLRKISQSQKPPMFPSRVSSAVARGARRSR